MELHTVWKAAQILILMIAIISVLGVIVHNALSKRWSYVLLIVQKYDTKKKRRLSIIKNVVTNFSVFLAVVFTAIMLDDWSISGLWFLVLPSTWVLNHKINQRIFQKYQSQRGK